MTTHAEVTIVGNVTRDPELRYLTSGTGLCTFSVAVNRRYQQNGEWKEDTSFFDVIAWRDLGDNVAESISKGDRVVVTGRLEQRSWENDAGDKRSKVEIVADDVAPSLRWATAQVSKVQRSSGSGQAGGTDAPPASTYEDAEPF